MANRYSNFPDSIDSLKLLPEYQELSNADKTIIARYEELIRKGSSLTMAEQSELNDIINNQLNSKMITSTDWNKLVGAILSTQEFYKNNVLTDISDMVNEKETAFNEVVSNKTNEFSNLVNAKSTEFTNTVTTQTNAMISKKNEFTTYVDTQKTNLNIAYSDAVEQMEDKKNYYITYTNTKQDEIRTLVQEFDSNTNRYFTSWTATDGQTDFNIFQGSNLSIPVDANLNIPEEHIDLIINGVMQTPLKDYVILNNGNFDTIRLTANASNLISAGTEVVVKWYKNVGKLYFHHSYTHGEGGTDPLTVTEGMLDSTIKSKLNNVNKKITVSTTAPTSPSINDIWIDIS